MKVTIDNDIFYDKHLEFTYRWYHKGGETGTNKLRVLNRLAFLEALNKWNQQYTTSGFLYVEEVAEEF